MPLIDANGGNDRGSPVTVYRAMAGVPVGAPTRPPVLFMRGKPPLMRLAICRPA